MKNKLPGLAPVVNVIRCFCLSLICLYTTTGFSQVISTIAGSGAGAFGGDGGPAIAATMSHPIGLAIDAGGNLYFADYNNNRIRKISTSGIISTYAGNGSAGFGGDGGPATAASIYHPYGVAVDNGGNLYIGDCGNQRVRKVDPSGVISTVAGTGVGGFSGDGGLATLAQIWNPTYLRTDNLNNVYFSDNQNHRVRKINTATGIITTVAGNGIAGYSGDGGAATVAKLNSTAGVFIDGAGNVYICEAVHGVIRKVDVSGNISTIAGTGVTGYSGDGGPATLAKLSDPEDITLDAAGNIYISDNGNSRIRKINGSGTISTIAGIGTPGFGGDGGPATAAMFNGLNGLEFNSAGSLHIVDVFNNRIRKLSPNNNIPTFTTGAVGTLALCVDELPTSINSLLAVSDLDAGQTLTWSVVTSPSHGTLSASYSATSTGGVVTPTGTSYMPTAGYTGTDMFKVQVFDGIAYDTITINVTISDVPSPGIILGIDSVCVGSSVTLTATAGGGVWSYVTGAAFVSSGVVTGVTPGIDTAVYTVTNACGTANAKKAIKVLPLPDAGVISGIDSVCVGGAITLSESATGGVWSHLVFGVSTVSSAGIVTGVAGGMDTIVYSATNTCGTASATFPVKVLPLPNAGLISGIDSVCPGQTITLSETVTGGVWGTTVSGVTTVSTAGVVSGLTTGFDTVTYTVTNSCGSATAQYVVEVLSVNYCHLAVEGIVGNVEACIVFPNPSDGNFSVLVQSPVSKEANVTITDVAGRKLKQFSLHTNLSSNVDMDLSPGVYLLNVTVDQKMLNKKIVVTR